MFGFRLGQQVDAGLSHPQHHPLIQEPDHDDLFLGSQGQMALQLQLVAGQNPKPCAVSVAFQDPEPGKNKGQHQAQHTCHFQGLVAQAWHGWQILDGGLGLLRQTDGGREQTECGGAPGADGPDKTMNDHGHL